MLSSSSRLAFKLVKQQCKVVGNANLLFKKQSTNNIFAKFIVNQQGNFTLNHYLLQEVSNKQENSEKMVAEQQEALKQQEETNKQSETTPLESKNETLKQETNQEKEENKQEEKDQKQQSKNKFTDYFKRLLSPTNLILPAVFGIVLYNFASYDVRQKKREGELKKQGSGTAVKAIGAPKLGGNFTLVNTKGEVITDSEFRGKYMLIYFGFTNCPDVCPTEMKKITRALQQIEKERPELAEKIVPIFISCDPPRDSIEAVIEYLSDYHPRFIGLTGTADQIARVCKKYRVYYSAPDYKEGKEDYLVDHSIFTYLMDPYGHLAEYFAQNTTADKIKERLLNACVE
ncbi:hypothetical protein ABK040_006384 [Willaertia magna]